MLSSYASNAVLSKARAMYGKRITDKNYNDLLSCNNVCEIASYLKHYTAYSSVLTDIDEHDVHRGYLEALLKQKLFYDFALLGRYDISVGEHFFVYMMSRAEVEQFMHSLMLISAGRKNREVYNIPSFFNYNAKVDLSKLADVKNYDEFLNVVKNSPYYDILLPFKNAENNIDLPQIETALYNYLYKVLFDTINKYVKGKSKEELLHLFNSYIDLNNFVRIKRMKESYNLSNDYIMSCLISFGNLSKKALVNLIKSKNMSSLMADIQSTHIGKKWMTNFDDDIDKIPKRMRFAKSKHNVRFSISPPVVLMSYIFLKDTEISNIINIIEGIRYKVPSSEISKMLIR